MMQTELWELFKDTGDPIGYLLYKQAESRGEMAAELPARRPENAGDGRT